MESLHRDVRQALRVLASKPGFTAVAIPASSIGLAAALGLTRVISGFLYVA